MICSDLNSRRYVTISGLLVLIFPGYEQSDVFFIGSQILRKLCVDHETNI
jgi:hypothetical protein